jgi:2-dehydropantoate 2-reductase
VKIAIAGAGAIGGLFAARLASSPQLIADKTQIGVLARGASLAAIQADGLRLESADGMRERVALLASSDPAQLGVQDVVVIAVKTTGLASLAQGIGPMIGPGTVIVSAMNGLPWWFGQGRNPKPAWAQQPLGAVDPLGVLEAALPSAQVVGCVTHLSASVPEPGVVKRGNGNRVLFGDPSRAQGMPPSARLTQVVKLFADAGFESVLAEDIERDVWLKLWGNMTMNPASAITGATGDLLLDEELVREFLSNIMREAAAVGERIDLPIGMHPEERHAMTRKLGAFKTSMLQDAEAGRPLELDALLAAVVELGERVGIAMPHARALLGLARVRAKVLQQSHRAGQHV